MELKTYEIEGIFKIKPNSNEFEMDLDLPGSSLRIRCFSKNLFLENTTKLEKEHAIYILEGTEKCYVGQSKNVANRINNHTENNKVDFHRCFILSKKGDDLRGYLDYMEAYTIKTMESLGYILDNHQKPNPEDDILKEVKKKTSRGWIDEFISMLPILGFDRNNIISTNYNLSINTQIQKTSELPLKKNLEKKEKIAPNKDIHLKKNKGAYNIKIEYNNKTFFEYSAIKTLIRFIEHIGVESVFNILVKEKQWESLCLQNIKDDKFKTNQSTQEYELNSLDGKKYYLYECSPTHKKIEFLKKIQAKLHLENLKITTHLKSDYSTNQNF